MNRCLLCYKLLDSHDEEGRVHWACAKKFYGTTLPPVIPYSASEMEQLALQVIRTRMSVAGVQPKISIALPKDESANQPKRFAVVGLWGSYILKPPSPDYPWLPELEDLSMHLASTAGMATVPHALIPLQSGSLAYLTRRIDRTLTSKLRMEDFCQLTERLTEHKYRGSYEQIARLIKKWSANPGLDLIRFAEMVLFSFLTGNSDMHLKNFSLIQTSSGMCLAPAYDLVATLLVSPDDREEMALTLNGKKRRITASDFATFGKNLGFTIKQTQSLVKKMTLSRHKWDELIGNSFIPLQLQHQFRQLIDERFSRFE